MDILFRLVPLVRWLKRNRFYFNKMQNFVRSKNPSQKRARAIFFRDYINFSPFFTVIPVQNFKASLFKMLYSHILPYLPDFLLLSQHVFNLAKYLKNVIIRIVILQGSYALFSVLL